MPITVQEINEKEFGETAFHNYKGYDVDTFLDYVADEVEALLNTNRELGERISQFEARVRAIGQMEGDLSRALETSRNAHQEIIKSAQEKAATILAEAQAAADAMIRETKGSAPEAGERRVEIIKEVEVPVATPVDMEPIRAYVQENAQQLIAYLETAVAP